MDSNHIFQHSEAIVSQSSSETDVQMTNTGKKLLRTREIVRYGYINGTELISKDFKRNIVYSLK